MKITNHLTEPQGKLEIDFTSVARLPAPNDNVAIATQILEGGTPIRYNGQQFQLSHTILEGHRFAIESISEEAPLLSWGLPFGFATRSIAPGDYVCNQKMIDSLSIRNLPFALPETPNFSDKMASYQLDETEFRSGKQVPRHANERPFLGYQRPGNRGVGTRNYIVVMGTTARTSGFARRLADMCSESAGTYPNIDGVVAVTHTEGGESKAPNNIDMLLRTLAGFTVHPNIGAILLVDYGTEAVTNEMLKAYMLREGYTLDDVVHHFHRLQGSFDTDLAGGAEIIDGWLESVNSVARTEQSLENLKIALQCGGSDAFSVCPAIRSPLTLRKRSSVMVGVPISQKLMNLSVPRLTCYRTPATCRQRVNFSGRLNVSRNASRGMDTPQKEIHLVATTSVDSITSRLNPLVPQ